MQVAKKYLQPQGTALPEGITIPPPTAMTATTRPGSTNQLFYQTSHVAQPHYTPVTVPMCDLQELVKHVQLTAAQQLADPITCNLQWKHFAGSRPLIMSADQLHGATALLLSPARHCLVPAFFNALKLKYAVVICYVPTAIMPPELAQFMRALKLQQLGMVIRAVAGWWLLVTQPPMNVDFWQRGSS